MICDIFVNLFAHFGLVWLQINVGLNSICLLTYLIFSYIVKHHLRYMQTMCFNVIIKATIYVSYNVMIFL
jgi:hypothetical protein